MSWARSCCYLLAGTSVHSWSGGGGRAGPRENDRWLCHGRRWWTECAQCWQTLIAANGRNDSRVPASAETERRRAITHAVSELTDYDI